MPFSARHIPNCISIARIFLVLPVTAAILNRHFPAALGWFVLAGLSDGVDGFLARRFGWQSRLGSYLDPVADKLLLASSYGCLAWLGLLPVWLAVLVLTRDAVIFSGAVAYYAWVGPFDGQPSLISKLNTLLQLLLVFVILAMPDWPALPPVLALALTRLVAFTTAASGVHYVIDWSRRYRTATHSGGA